MVECQPYTLDVLGSSPSGLILVQYLLLSRSHMSSNESTYVDWLRQAKLNAIKLAKDTSSKSLWALLICGVLLITNIFVYILVEVTPIGLIITSFGCPLFLWLGLSYWNSRSTYKQLQDRNQEF